MKFKYKGMLVQIPGGKGVGKIESVDGETCSVSLFRSLVRSETLLYPVSSLERAFISPQTRVYVQDDDRVRVGRVVDYLLGENGLVTYEVRFPNSKRKDFNEVDLFLRPWTEPEDPAEVLANGGAESQYLFDRRQAAMIPLTELRGATQGLTALVSAGIDMAPHQVAAVRRVLTDPVQRYLLADEVGLGKTIEAGLIIRQHLIDNPDTTTLIVVPTHLVTQWQQELRSKLRLDQFDSLVEVIPHSELSDAASSPDILVIDEAHHLVGIEEGPLAPSAASLSKLAEKAQVLLLLSATPALGNETRFLALLNLLDPVSHSLSDVDGFKRKLETRIEIGRILLSLDPSSPKLVLRQRAAELSRLFPEDPLVLELAPRLIAATRELPDELTGLCLALKNHIADSYRIHQRLIRSRRADAQGWEFAPRGPYQGDVPSFSHVRVESDQSVWILELLPAIEEWRVTSLERTNDDPNTTHLVAKKYAELLSALAGGKASLMSWLEKTEQSAANPEEQEILSRMIGLLSGSDDQDRIDVGVESTRRLALSLKKEGVGSPKIVIFTSSSAEVENFCARLSEKLDGYQVLPFVASGQRIMSRELEQFSDPAKCAVLVCDLSGEEGLNLSWADAIVHLDLPLSASRLEQRIGRLDRFGRRKGIIRHRVILPVDDDESPWLAWYEFLSSALQIFHRSVSDIQFLIEGFEDRFFKQILAHGAQSIENLCLEINNEIREERKSQDEQYALDRIAVTEQPVEKFLEAIDDAEEREGDLEEAIDKWLVETLHLQKRPFSWPEKDPFKLFTTKETLIPRFPWLEGFGLDGNRALTWRRRVAMNRSDVTILRPGTPLIDILERYTRWDDRGTAFVTWRTADDWSGDLWLGFRLSFIIEPDIPISDFFAPNRREIALMRRAQRFLAPRSQTLLVSADGNEVQDDKLRSILNRSYRKIGSGQRNGDLNLGSRPDILAKVIDPSEFARLCRTVRNSAHVKLREDAEFTASIGKASLLATEELQRWQNRLLRRQVTGDASADADIEALQAVLRAIENPSVRLDSMGCFVLSNNRDL